LRRRACDPRTRRLNRLQTLGPYIAPESPLMTVPAILAIVLFVAVFAALNRFEFGRFD
jgi:hypothetical protein